MTAAELVAIENTQGVVDYAASLGETIANNADAAYDFLRRQYDIRPDETGLKIKSLHPHLPVLEKIKPVFNGKCRCGCSGNCEVGLNGKKSNRKYFFNFNDEELDEITMSASEIFSKGVDKGKEVVKSIGSDLARKDKDHTNEILKYGAVLLVGVFIGKFLMK